MIKIIDIYSGNEWWNPYNAVAEGYSGVIFKAGQGTWPDVPRVKKEWFSEARAAGLKVGWYWLVDSRYKASAQVKACREATGDDYGELGLWADCEKPVLAWKESVYWKSAYPGLANIVDFIYLFEKQLGIRVGVYTSPGFWKTVTQRPNQAHIDYLSKSKLWTAQYPWVYVDGISKPTMYGKWDKWTFWQHRERPDVNKYNGTWDEFDAEFSGDTVVIQPPVVNEDYRYVSARAGLILRDSPAGARIKALKYNTRVRVIDTVDGWCKIDQADGVTESGWLSEQYLRS